MKNFVRLGNKHAEFSAVPVEGVDLEVFVVGMSGGVLAVALRSDPVGEG